MSMAEDIAPMEVDCVQMYKLVLTFKDTLSKLFSESGLMEESSRLRDLQTMSIETGMEHHPSAQQLSSNVLLVFQLIVELVHAILVSKRGEPGAMHKEEKATQIEDGSPDQSSMAITDSTEIKYEKDDENSDDNEVPVVFPSLPEPPVPSIPLRKSLRTSVLNRKPFVTPRQTRRKLKPPSKEPTVSPTVATSKPPTKPPTKTHTKPLTRSAPKPTGAKKRKLGAIKKKVLLAKAVKKAGKEVVVAEALMEGVKEEEGADDAESRPRRGRRSVLATTMYERTADGKFRCLECGKVAKLQTNIRKHLRKHTGEKPYRCTMCPVAFAYPRSLKRHQLVHEGVRPYQCLECDKRFFDPTSLRTHSRVHTNDRPFVCQECGDRFRQKEGLKGHMRRHTGDRPYVCEHCGMAFAAKRSLTRHIRVHTGERPYSCDQCVAAFADWTTLHNHKLVHRGSGAGEGDGEGEEKKGEDGEGRGAESRPYQCQFCGIRYRQPLSLKRHLRLHSSNPDPKKAPAVRRAAKRRGEDGEVGGEEETVALHLQYRPYACELCGLRFKHLRGYDTHKTKHQSGALTAKKLPAKRLKQEGVEGELNPADIKQAATILASVAVNNTALTQDIVNNAGLPQDMINTTALPHSIVNSAVLPHEMSAHPELTSSPHGIGLGTDSSVVSSVSVPHHISLPHHLSLPHSNPLPHTITLAPNATIAIPPSSSSLSSSSSSQTHHHHSSSNTSLPMSLLPPAPQAEPGTVTIIDAATFSSMASEPPGLHLPVSTTPVLTDTGDMVHYTSGNVTQVIQYPDGTLSEVTTLVPHPPPPSIIPSSDLLDSVVTVVFETRDGNVVLENQ